MSSVVELHSVCCRDKATNALKGDGTVSYEDPFSAASAIEWFNNKEWKGAQTPCTRPAL